MNYPIAENLRTLRKLNRLSQEEVAERVGVSRQAVAKWEGGDTVPDLPNCAALADLYRVSLDDLIRFSDPDLVPGVPPKGKHVFGTVTVGDRGQIVIPKKARDIFQIQPGDELMVLGDEDPATRGLALVNPTVFLAQLEAARRALGLGDEK